MKKQYVFGGIAVVAVILVLVFIFIKRRKNTTESKATESKATESKVVEIAPKIEIIGKPHVDETKFKMSVNGMEYSDTASLGDPMSKNIKGYVFEVISKNVMGTGSMDAADGHGDGLPLPIKPIGLPQLIFNIKSPLGEILLTKIVFV